MPRYEDRRRSRSRERRESPPRNRRDDRDDRDYRRKEDDSQRRDDRRRSRDRSVERSRRRSRSMERLKNRDRSRSPIMKDRDRDRDRKADNHRSRDAYRRSKSPRNPSPPRDRDRRHDNYKHRSRDNDEQRSRNDQQPFNRRKRRRYPSEDTTDFPYGSEKDCEEPDAEPQPEPEKPNFELTGTLAADTNTVNGAVLKFNEPSDAMKPTKQWRLYPFKDGQALPHIDIHTRSSFLIGRDRRICDIPVDHPSCSSQHAVIQFRNITSKLPDGSTKKKIRPYIIDLESSNGTKLNDEPIEAKRFVELRAKDSLKFALSTREYILLHADSQ